MGTTYVHKNRGVDQENVAYIHTGILLTNKRWALAICEDMDGTGGHYGKQNKPEGEKQILDGFTYTD